MSAKSLAGSFSYGVVGPLYYIYLGVHYDIGDIQGLDSIRFSLMLTFGDCPIFGLLSAELESTIRNQCNQDAALSWFYILLANGDPLPDP